MRALKYLPFKADLLRSTAIKTQVLLGNCAPARQLLLSETSIKIIIKILTRKKNWMQCFYSNLFFFFVMLIIPFQAKSNSLLSVENIKNNFIYETAKMENFINTGDFILFSSFIVFITYLSFAYSEKRGKKNGFSSYLCKKSLLSRRSLKRI
ncbi:MAG: hypothetical protein H0X26_06600 [Alphaproteobacteria bacterium]|nr:hypothetical protein [Alphaproteobacteria bacterium]